MRVPDIIAKKRDGGELSREEIEFMIRGATSGEIPDYQMTALLMAVYFRGMTPEETTALTLAMAHSGALVDLAGIRGVKVDKHSTGGVGDTTTLVLAPLVAAAGARVAKMSGRGLGHTGGTLDKLESIPGFRISLAPSEFIAQVNTVGVAVVGQTADVAPADKILYALRDVTATVDSIPLIAASIMSKKIATGADVIVLDVKVGSGAFMRSLADARNLASLMVEIGRMSGRRTAAVISDMSQPLGRAVGNSLEVREAVHTLRGEGSRRLLELCLELASRMTVLAGVHEELGTAREHLEMLIKSGVALAKLRDMVAAQGGDPTYVDFPERLPVAPFERAVVARGSGHVARADALTLGRAAMAMGAGRARKEDPIDLSVGLVTHAEVGDEVHAGQCLATLYASSRDKLEEGASIADGAFSISETPVAAPPLVYEAVDA
ncbi:MAG: pyrimidine-nucleoside phosphorylase [Firmicutes bacterium]|nr:pyrimidine-nucleoside phosphorylase [Bacillota bacterium]